MFLNKLHTGQFISMDVQVKRWHKANRKMGWSISGEEFRMLESGLLSYAEDSNQAYSGKVLCYGFGDDGGQGSDSVLSGKRAWQYASRLHRLNTWQCQYIDFDQSDHIRLRPEAPIRPKGFYLADVHLPDHAQTLTVSRFRKQLPSDRTGLGPEGIQMVVITHPHFAIQMNESRLPLIALADFDVAPYGYYDFFDAMQMACSINTLGLGIGNIDRNYPLFGIPDMGIDFLTSLSASGAAG
jgi:hypothetical protein